MSLHLIRDDLLGTKKNEIAAALEAHRRHLTLLYRLTKFVANPLKLVDLNFSSPPTPDEERFLDENDLDKGRFFQDATLPFPPQPDATLVKPKTTPSLLPPQARAPSPLSPAHEGAGKADAPYRLATPIPVEPPTASSATPPLSAHTPPRSPHSSQPADQQPTRPEESGADREQTQRLDSPEDPTAESRHAVPLPAQDAAEPRKNDASPPTRDGGRPAKVVHLPPKEVQIKHIRDVERAQEAARIRENREDAAAGLTMASSAADAVSSPSSTAGPASTSTPKPNLQSPDTSPEVESSPSTRAEALRALPPHHDAGSEISISHIVQERDKMSIDTEALVNRVLQGRDQNADDTTRTAPNDDKMQVDAVEEAPDGPNEAGRSSSQLVPVQLPHDSRRKSSPVSDIVMGDRPPAPGIMPSASKPSTTARPSAIVVTPQRMTTRVTSGAIRQKSVSEILGATQKRSQPESTSPTLVLVSPKNGRRDMPTTPSEERPKHSLVVFSKRDRDLSRRDLDSEPDGYLALKGASLDQNKDYMRPLFINQAYQPPRAASLPELVSSAHKIITTSNLEATLKEQGDYKILRRIYQLQNANKWSLRQMTKFPDPQVPISRQDHLVNEMKWMRTDFREERRWKMAVSRNLAEWCSLYVMASDDVKQHLCVKAKRPSNNDAQPMEIADSFDSTPPLEHSGSTPSDQSLPDDLPPVPFAPSTPPTALFWLGHDDLVFQVDNTPAAEGVLNELPLYESKPSSVATDQRYLVPVSKFARGKLVPVPSSAPRKRSRYEYEEEDSDVPTVRPAKRRNSDISLFMSPSRRTPRFKELSPEESDVALFNPVNRHIRERLHAAHAFRPPSEFLMPSTNFFETRQPSQWTWEEDQRLRKCVKDYSYNWSIISIELTNFTQPSKLTSGTERRTPWECFERWVQLEGLPNDMGKTQYFRTWLNRLEAANKTVQQQRAVQQQAQQPAQTPNQIPQARVKGTQPYRVERRRDARYISMVDAIRKITRKRENQAHRQHETAKAAAMRKQQQSNENNHTKPVANSVYSNPTELLRTQYEKNQKSNERTEAYRRQMLEQQQKNAQLQQRTAQMGMQQNIVNLAAQQQQQQQQQQRTGTPSNGQGPNAQSGQLGPSGSNANMQTRHIGQMMQAGMANGVANGVPNGMQMPQAQMQGLQGQQRIPNLSQEQMRIAMQQRQLVAAQNGQHFGMHPSGQANGLAAAHLSLANGSMQNPQLLAALAAQQRAAGMANSMAQGNSASPRGPHPNPNLNMHKSQLSSGMMPTITYFQQKAQQQYPQCSQEDITKIAHEQLKSHIQRMTATAASAAAGMPAMMNNAVAPMGSNAFAQQAGMLGNHSPQQYQAQLHRQMQQQQARMSGSPGINAAQPRPVSRGATPQGAQQMQGNTVMHQRSGSGHGGMSQEPSESPRLPTAQMTRP